MTPGSPEQVARALLRARREQRPVDAAPLAETLRTADEAYAAQALVARGLPGAPACAEAFPRHWKSGGPSRQATLTHAALPDAGVWPGPARAGAWHFNLRLIEVEIALRLGREVTAAQAASLTQASAPEVLDAMTVSIEIVDSRWRQGVSAPALLKLADLQSHGALVLGEWRPFAPRDWVAQRCEVRIGAQTHAFVGAHSLGDPAWLLPIWLRHATRHGASAPKGTVVTTGTWCGMLPARAGDAVRATFEGIGQAEVRL